MGNRHWIHWLPKQLSSKLSGRINLQAVIANSAWLMGEKVLRIVLGLIVGAWVARYLGPSQYGEIAYAVAYIAFFQAITSLGIDGIVVREMSYDKTQAVQILSTGFILRFGTGLLCWLTAVAVMILIHGWNDRTTWIVAIVGSGLIFQAADTIDLWFQSQSQSRTVVIVKLLTFSLTNCIKVIMVVNHASLLSFAAIIALESSMNAAGFLLIYKKILSKIPLEILISNGRLLLKESWPIMLSGLSIMIYMRIDQLIIKEILGDKELGIYAAMLSLSSIWYILPLTLTSSLAPWVARKKAEGEDAYYSLFTQIFKFFFAASLAISLVVFLASDLTVNLLYGPAYQEAATLLKIHIFSIIPVYLGVAQSLWITNEKNSNIALKKALLGGGASITLSIILIPRIGLTGAAYSAVISYFISAILSNLFFARKIFFLQFGINISGKKYE